MAIYTGYVDITHGSYNSWRNATLGNGYDYDQSYGLQCYDLLAEFWQNVGFPAGYPVTGGSINVYDVWTNRNNNVSFGGVTYFDLITNVNNIKTGDIIIYSATVANPYGHAGFANSNYDGSTEFPILSQNNGGTPYPSGGSTVNIHGYNINLFMGAFRYRAWQSPAPLNVGSSKFPFVLYAKRLREARQNML